MATVTAFTGAVLLTSPTLTWTKLTGAGHVHWKSAWPAWAGAR